MISPEFPNSKNFNPVNNPSKLLIGILVAQTLTLAVYTFLTIGKEGWNLFPIITSNISSMTWSGQFNADFSCYLLLSGMWIMWRNKFSSSSIIISLAAMIIGIMVFAPYLIYLTIKEKGDLRKVLLGLHL